MRSRTLAALAVASMLVLAGCSFGGGGSPTATGASGQADGGASSSFTYPAGLTSSGVANATAATDAHTALLVGTSGFVVEYDATVTTPNTTSYVTYDQRVDTGSREIVRRTNVTTGNLTGLVVRYYRNGTVYVRSDQPGSSGTAYSNQSRQYELDAFTGAEFLEPGLSGVTYGSSEVTNRDGTTVVVYGDATLDAAEGLFGREITTANVTDFSATLVVDEDGRIHEFSYSATVHGDRSVDVAITTVDVGDTTVEAPGWISRA